MKAIILAAGKPTFTDTAITQITIEGESLIDIQVSALRNAGVEDIHIVRGYDAENSSRSDLKSYVNAQWETSGSAQSLYIVRHLFDAEDDIIVCYGDSLFEPDAIKALLHAKSSLSALCFLDRSGRDSGHYREYASIKEGELSTINNTPPADAIRTVYTGITLIRKERSKVIHQYLEDNLYSATDHLGGLINRMITLGAEVAPIIVEHGWAEITSADQYNETLKNTVLIEKILQIHTDWTQRSKRYNRLDWVNNDALLNEIISAALQVKPSQILDVGTGTGKVIRALRDACSDSECWAVDYSQSMLDKIEDNSGIRLLQANAESMDGLPGQYFDLITARMVFHHIDDTSAALAAISGLLKPGGHFLICEGVPPTIRTVKWYTEMFRFKEDRNTLTEVDLINMISEAGCESILTRTIIMRKASLNNWLDNSGIPEENIRIIKEMHYSAPDHVKEDYDMEFTEDDCLMTWRFAVTMGQLPDQSD